MTDVYGLAPRETPQEKLDRLHRTLEYHERQTGRHAGIQAARLRREVVRLAKAIAYGHEKLLADVEAL